MSGISKKWLPGLIVPVAIVLASITVPLQANAVVDLPDKTAQEVLLMVNQDPNIAFSATITKSADLGFPALNLSTGMTDSMAKSAQELAPKGMEDFVPQAANSAQLAAALELVSGTQNARVYVDGPKKLRLQILDRMSERDFVVNDNKVWFYDAGTATVTYAELPKMPANLANKKAEARAIIEQYLQLASIDISTPAKAANLLLSNLDASTKVSVGSDAKVAGRTVYQLILEPRAAVSLVDSITIAIDSETGLPLDLTVKAKGQKAPAFELGFTSIDFAKPNAAIFDYATPPGATVTTVPMPTQADLAKAEAELNKAKSDYLADPAKMQAMIKAQLKAAGVDFGALNLNDLKSGELPYVTGRDWSTVIDVPASLVPAGILDNDTFSNLTKKVAGGRVISTSLFNVLITDDGHIFAGAVTIEALQASASK